MKYTILTLLCCLTLLGPVKCAAQSSTNINLPIYYHWVGPEQLILWKSLDDHPVTVRRQNEQWIVDETDMVTWRPVLEQIAKAYSLTEAGTISPSDLAWYVAAKIHNDPSNKIARPRDPDVTIYLSPSDRHAKVAFIDGGAARPVSAEFSENNTSWSKAGDVNLLSIFNVADSAAELAKIFSLDSENIGRDDWKVAWQQWLVKFRAQNPPARNFYYPDKDNKTRWIWQERLGNDQPIPNGPRLSVPGPRIDEPNLTSARRPGTQNSSWGFGWGFGLGLAVGALLIIAPVAAYIFYAWSARKRGKSVETAGSPAGDPSRAEDLSPPQAVDARTLEVLHQTAIERWEKRTEAGPVRDMFSAAFEWAGKQYREAAKAENLLIDATAQEKRILDDYRQKTLKLTPDTDDETVRQWVMLGELTTKAIEAVRPEIPDLANSVSSDSAMSAWTNKKWASKWPALLGDFNSLLKEVRRDRDDIRTQLSGIEQRHEEALRQKEEFAKAEWQQELASSNSRLGQVSTQLNESVSQLQIANQKIEELEAACKSVEMQLATAGSERDDALRMRAELDDKMSELTAITFLSRNLRSWLQGFSTISHRVDNNALAPLAALVNFSVSQMCIAVIEGAPDLKRALARNVFVVYQKFVQAAGAPGLSHVLESLDKVAPGAESFELREDERGGVSLDDDLMRSFVYELKKETGQNVSPFYTDIDTNKKILVFVSTS
jgi:hypothetical protein